MECAVVTVSLVVPTYKRSGVVVRCLDSAQHQTLADFELLLVDNSPDTELRALVDDFNQTARRTARYVAEPRLGLHNARHAGARAATGDVLVFTDDDAGFDPHWLAAYARCFGAHPEMAAAGGPIRPAWESPPPDWLTAFMRADPTMFAVLSLLDLSREFQLRRDGIFFGVNMAIRRDVLFQQRQSVVRDAACLVPRAAFVPRPLARRWRDGPEPQAMGAWADDRLRPGCAGVPLRVARTNDRQLHAQAASQRRRV